MSDRVGHSRTGPANDEKRRMKWSSCLFKDSPLKLESEMVYSKKGVANLNKRIDAYLYLSLQYIKIFMILLHIHGYM